MTTLRIAREPFRFRHHSKLPATPMQIAAEADQTCELSDDCAHSSDDYLTKQLSGFDGQDITG
jgi:hypothetical protein